MQPIIVNQVSKSYPKGKELALNQINFEVEAAEIFGLIGPDGAGKTTLFRILSTLLIPDTGQAHVCGYDIQKDWKKIRKIIGYMPGKFSLYQDLSVEENLNFFAVLFNTSIKENYHLIKEIYQQIEPFKNRQAGKLSGGMKQKLALCCALIHKPEVLFLDEPTTGVDAVSRKEFWGMLKNLKKEGISIIVSTPYMDEASMCDNIAFINDGKILLQENPKNIAKHFKGKLFEISTPLKYNLLQYMQSHVQIKSCFAFGDSLHVRLKEPFENDFHSLFNAIQSETNIEFTFSEISPIIEDCFIDKMLHV